MGSLFQPNDWRIKATLTMVAIIQLGLWITTLSDTLGPQILILRQILGFAYVTFVPGILILRILRLHQLGDVHTILYAVGLSIGTVMFVGLFLNTFSAFLGLSDPVSLTPLEISMGIAVSVLGILSFARDRDYSGRLSTPKLSPMVLTLLILPFLSILGTYLANYYNVHVLLFALLAIISIIPLIVVFLGKPSDRLLPLLTFLISVSLLYSWSLTSTYLAGADIHYEYYFANLVKTNSRWFPDISNPLNGMLSVVMLAPAYSDFLSMDLVWVFKIVYPLLYALVPVGLYRAFEKQTTPKIGFLATVYFMFALPFFSELFQLARQEIAELFVVLLILLIVDNSMIKIKRSFLFIVFSAVLVVSHYGTSYLFVFSLAVAWLLLYLPKSSAMRYIGNMFRSAFRQGSTKLGNRVTGRSKKELIDLIVVFESIVFVLSWYIYVAGSSSFNRVVQILNNMIGSIFNGFLNPNAAQGLATVLNEFTPLHEITKYLYLFSEFLIVVGVLALLWSKRFRFTGEYKAFCLAQLGILFSALALPYFGGAMNTTRVYNLTLLFLAPSCVIGLIGLFEVCSKLLRKRSDVTKISLRAFAIFACVFLLFSSGFIYEIGRDLPSSIALNSNMDYPRYNYGEVTGAQWAISTVNTSIIYADEYGKYLLNEFVPENQTAVFDSSVRYGYLYLRTISVETGMIAFVQVGATVFNRTYQSLDSYAFYAKADIIYSNGESELIYNPAPPY